MGEITKQTIEMFESEIAKGNHINSTVWEESQLISAWKKLNQTKPLSDEEIMIETFRHGLTVSKGCDVFLLEHDVEALVKFARAIEERILGK